MNNCPIGIIGLGIMGRNLALNFASRGLAVAVHDMDPAAVAALEGAKGVHTAVTFSGFLSFLRRPRTVMLMVPAGPAVDTVIGEIADALEAGDLVVDGGNSAHRDTSRRIIAMEERGLLFVGCGVSGGRRGALEGPCFMPGGSEAARAVIMPLLEAAAARLPGGAPACAWIGPEGSGHFVKTVHNGIEYAIMQAIAESYDMLGRLLGVDTGECAAIFDKWQAGPLGGYLVGSAAAVLSRRESGGYLVDLIRDRASHKGSGLEAVTAAREMGVPVPMLDEALAARLVSRRTRDRDAVRRAFGDGIAAGEGRVEIDDIEQALFCAKAVAVSEGFALLSAASRRNGWPLDFPGIARIWQAGCIIQSCMMKLAGDAMGAIPADFTGSQILALEPMAEEIRRRIPAWRRAVAAAVTSGIPVPALASALFHVDALRAGRLPANLLQAQRDYFGSHGFERVDAEPGALFHADWDEKSK